MVSMLLMEMPRFGLGSAGPVRLLARNNGKYVRPIIAYGIDMRMEDNPYIPKDAMLMNASWVAKHPIDELYIVYDGDLAASRATLPDVRDWLMDKRRAAELKRVEFQIVRLKSTQLQPKQPEKHDGPKPVKVYVLPVNGPGAWWKWVEAADDKYNLIKAPFACRGGDMSPEEVDEALSDKLDRVLATG